MRVWTVWMDFWGVAVTRLWTMKSLTGWTLSKVGLLGLILTILMEPISEYPTWKQTSPPENGQLQHGKSFFAAPNHGSVALQNYPSRLSGMIRLCHPLATSLCHVTSGKIYLLYVYRQTDNNKIKQNTDRFWFSFDWEPRWDPIDSEVFTMVNPMPETCVKKKDLWNRVVSPQPAGTPKRLVIFRWFLVSWHRSSRGCMASLIFEDHPGGFSMSDQCIRGDDIPGMLWCSAEDGIDIW